MGWKTILSFIFFLVVIILLGFYWIAPLSDINFGFKDRNYNFSLNDSDKGMQFHSNMRFPTSSISYRIYDCPLGKKGDMEMAFEIISNKTTLSFYPVVNSEEIDVTCDSKNKRDGEFFIAGEGGPTNVTKTSNFNVIKGGQILLIRESQCATPNVGIHELLHVLGFDHSTNPNNIMYNFSTCDQEISQDVLDTIDKLYSTPTYADLSIENASAVMHGKYLDANITVMNNGLKDSQSSTLKIYADEKLIKEFDIKGLDIGYGRKIILQNVLVFQLDVNELKFVVSYDEPELAKENNEVILNINKN
jgi:hypothetical protein